MFAATSASCVPSSLLPTHSLHLTLLLFATMRQSPAWVGGSNLELHNEPSAAGPCTRYNGQSRDVQSAAEWNLFFWVLHKVPGRAPGGGGSTRGDWRRLSQPLGGRDAQHAKTAALMTLARFHYCVLSPLRVYEVWKSIWPGLEVHHPTLLSSNPQSIARLELRPLLSSDVWSCPVTNCLPLLRLRRQSVSSSGLLTAAAVSTLPSVAVEILLVFLSILCAETMKKILLGE